MTDLTQDEVISKVSSIFDVKDIVINTDDIQFKIEDKDFKSKFVKDRKSTRLNSSHVVISYAVFCLKKKKKKRKKKKKKKMKQNGNHHK